MSIEVPLRRRCYWRVKGSRKASELVVDGDGAKCKTLTQMQMNSIEARRVQIENDRLTKENGEMRDLCCYLDEDRAKTRKLCKEWQKFARHTAKLMKQVHAFYC